MCVVVDHHCGDDLVLNESNNNQLYRVFKKKKRATDLPKFRMQTLLLG